MKNNDYMEEYKKLRGKGDWLGLCALTEKLLDSSNKLQEVLDKLQYTNGPEVRLYLSDENCIDVAVIDPHPKNGKNWNDKTGHPKKITPFQSIEEALGFALKELEKII